MSGCSRIPLVLVCRAAVVEVAEPVVAAADAVVELLEALPAGEAAALLLQRPRRIPVAFMAPAAACVFPAV